MIKAVVFDLNGVFLQSEYLTDRIEREFGISSSVSKEILTNSLNKVRLGGDVSIYTYWKELFNKHNLDISEEKFLSFWFRGEKLVPELVSLAKKLRKDGIEVYIFSNNFRERTEYYRKNFKEIFANVDKAFFSWETRLVKSDPNAYKHLLDEIGHIASEVLYFDDSLENVSLANRLGIRAYFYENLAKTKEIIKEELS
jgi:HAD superfamily hydrolase (TIGR01509 family)